MRKLVLASLVLATALSACSGKKKETPAATAAPAAAVGGAEPTTAAPPMDPNNIVSIAMGSKDHTTLVAALKAANYVAAIANPGPLTVFAPTNEAFARLPAGTVENLTKPENQAQLKEILKYHATTSVYQAADLKDGMQLAMSNGAKVAIHVGADGAITVNDAHVLASIRASNGIVHVVDGVLLPPAK